MAMIHLGLINKEIATDLNMNVSTVLGIHTAQKYSDVNKRRVSDYLKAKLTEKKPNA
jgi:FixJ family two-component response regulator